jgi:hypothetical protein
MSEYKCSQAHYFHEATSSFGLLLSEVIYLLLKISQAYLKPVWFSALLMV